MAAGDPLDEEREERFCQYCGALLPECCELMLWDGEPNKEGDAMCMRTGNTLTIPEWAEDYDGG